jgi:hypothetical protein
VTKKLDPFLYAKLVLAEYLGVEEHEIALEKTEPFSILSKESKKKVPLEIGCAIGHISSDNFGTLGCFVEDKNLGGDKFLLTNYHVLYDEQSSRHELNFVIQPARTHGGRKRTL